MSQLVASYFKNKRVWITGGSSGIGLELVKQCLSLGCTVVATSRSRSAYETLSSEFPELNVVSADVSIQSEVKRAVDEILSQVGGIDIAILNAGTAEYMQVSHFKSDVFERMIQTNFLSMVYCIEYILPLLRQSQCPHLVTMSSLSAYGGLTQAAAYGASKAAILNMSQSLQMDCVKEGIEVTNVSPGFVKTPLTDKNTFPMIMVQQVEKAGQLILAGIAKKKLEVHFPKTFSLTMKLLTSLPASWYRFIVRRLTNA